MDDIDYISGCRKKRPMKMFAIDTLINTSIYRINCLVEVEPCLYAILSLMNAPNRARCIACFKQEGWVNFLHGQIPTRTKAESAY